MVNTGEAIPKLRLRLPPFQAIKSNLKDYWGRNTAGAGGFCGGHKRVVELLISKGANANITDNDGNTPILLAEDRGYEEIAVFLHKHGAKERSA